MAITNRNQLIREVYQLLNKEGFETSNIYEQSCFDIVARKKLLILLLKVLVNIDSINESHVEEIRQISNVFLASPIKTIFWKRMLSMKDMGFLQLALKP